jgi:hypothetical protein
MIDDKVYKAKKDLTGPFNITIKKNDELHIVRDIVYVNGYPLPFDMQTTIYDWLKNNENFEDDTRVF